MLKTIATIALAAMMGFVLPGAASAEEPHPAGALTKMPVKEVSVFKDGHAFCLHTGRLPLDQTGNVVMDYLPAPVLGAFWPECTEVGAKLAAVTAGQRRVTVRRSALTIPELIEANIDRQAIITESSSLKYEATIVGMTVRGSKELEEACGPDCPQMLPQKGKVVLLKTCDGVRAVNVSEIKDVTFKGEPNRLFTEEQFRNMLTLRLDWSSKLRPAAADVSLMYLQRGIRWIPNYQVTIDGQGNATIRLQATLINELTDLNDTTCHLVIGVPTFTFKGVVDPIALQKTARQLSQYFREESPRFENIIMGQHARMSGTRGTALRDDEGGLGPQVTGSAEAEDLFVFTVEHVTLKKGQAMVLPVTEFVLPYKDVYVLDLPFAPPMEAWRNFNDRQRSELERLLAKPKVMHNIRLTNTSEQPLTTAPALIIAGDRLLGQGLMTYTAAGGTSDLPVTAAVDIRVAKSERETRRMPNAATFDGHSFVRVDLTGIVSLTNFKEQAVDLEVVRYAIGNVTEADHEGEIEMVNVFEDPSFIQAGASWPNWWAWHSWPYWWRHLNGVGKVTWKFTLKAGESVDLKYGWNYYWR